MQNTKPDTQDIVLNVTPFTNYWNTLALALSWADREGRALTQEETQRIEELRQAAYPEVDCE